MEARLINPMRKTLELAGILILGILVWITWSALSGPDHLPDKVPTHFDAAGHPDAWGSTAGMILLPLIAGAVYLMMSVVSRFPAAFNYPVRATPQTLPRLQSVTLDMICWLKIEIAALFAVLQWAFVQAARSGEGRIFPEILPFFIVAIFGTVGWHLIALIRIAHGAGRNSAS